MPSMTNFGRNCCQPTCSKYSIFDFFSSALCCMSLKNNLNAGTYNTLLLQTVSCSVTLRNTNRYQHRKYTEIRRHWLQMQAMIDNSVNNSTDRMSRQPSWTARSRSILSQYFSLYCCFTCSRHSRQCTTVIQKIECIIKSTHFSFHWPTSRELFWVSTGYPKHRFRE